MQLIRIIIFELTQNWVYCKIKIAQQIDDLN